MESRGAIPHYLDVEVGVLTTLVLSDAPILARKDIDNPGLELSRKNIVVASHRICNASCDTGDSLQTESVHVYFSTASRAQVPFRDREKRSSEVIPLKADTQPHCKDEYARLPG